MQTCKCVKRRATRAVIVRHLCTQLPVAAGCVDSALAFANLFDRCDPEEDEREGEFEPTLLAESNRPGSQALSALERPLAVDNRLQGPYDGRKSKSCRSVEFSRCRRQLAGNGQPRGRAWRLADAAGTIAASSCE